jgi:hypothetical protein
VNVGSGSGDSSRKLSIGEALHYMFRAKGHASSTEIRRESLGLCPTCGPMFQSLIESFVAFVDESEPGSVLHNFLKGDEEEDGPLALVPVVIKVECCPEGLNETNQDQEDEEEEDYEETDVSVTRKRRFTRVEEEEDSSNHSNSNAGSPDFKMEVDSESESGQEEGENQDEDEDYVVSEDEEKGSAVEANRVGNTKVQKSKA